MRRPGSISTSLVSAGWKKTNHGSPRVLAVSPCAPWWNLRAALKTKTDPFWEEMIALSVLIHLVCHSEERSDVESLLRQRILTLGAFATCVPLRQSPAKASAFLSASVSLWSSNHQV